MNEEWSLDILYKSIDDPKYKEDVKKFEGMADFLKAEYEKALKLDDVNKVKTLLLAEEEYVGLVYKLFAFTMLYLATNGDDGDAMASRDKLSRIDSGCTGIDTVIRKELGKISNLSELCEKDALIKEYRFLLEENIEKCKHMLSDAEEEMISVMDSYAGSAWSNFRDYMTSNVKLDYEDKELTLTELRNLAYSSDSKVRKAAYEAEIAGYKKFEEAVAFSLNNIKNQVIEIGKRRGYESPLSEALFKSRMKKETLDAMMGAIREYIPRLRDFYKAKAKALGHKNGLPWYDLYAPTGSFDRDFTTEECRDYLIKCFSTFSSDMSDLMKEAFDNSWIDFFPKKGKLGGAFDYELLGFGQSRVLTNFDGKFGSVDTLAHELGHAFHDRQIKDQRILNHDYTMPIAETASTFNETFLGHYAMNDADDNAKISLLDSSLTESLQCIIDITSRYIFETNVFEKCQDKFLMPDDLNEIMINAQKETYGDALDPKYMHRYMWACKSHYYSSDLSFYNFPYAFGLLFSQGLYALYLKEGDEFVKKYEKMLHDTVSCSIEDCGKAMGVDITKPDFWRNSLEIVAKDVEEYCKLTNFR